MADMVAALTKDMRMKEQEREVEYDRQLVAASWPAKLVKLADVYDNFCDTFEDQQRVKARKKAERAIACAGDDPRLKDAVAAVGKLLDERH